MYSIDFHADDYGISLNNSKRMIELINAGRLDSISIIPNMGCFDECMALLRDNWDGFPVKPLISVHINLIDGFMLSSEDKSTILNNTWGKLFIRSFSVFGRKRFKEQLCAEIEAQIKTVCDATADLTDDKGSYIQLRLDSHVHTHMIPIVFDSMIEALRNSAALSKVSYIRNSTEPLKPFFANADIRGTYPAVNVIKNLILNILGRRVAGKCDQLGIQTGMLWGLIMSGCMDRERVDILLPRISSIAQKKDEYLEILCHPGIVLADEKRPEYGPDDLTAFFSQDRDKEYDMIMSHR